MAIIEVKHLTKEYQLGKLINLKDTALNVINRLQGKPLIERERFKALDDIDFQIEEGEVVGIIGTNGAGKSTLLKHLAHISTPTQGEVYIRGSVAPLIEVGAGLNPELTGRENIFLNGAILGIPKKVIRQKLDEIVEFAELEQFIDTPIKRYSSGMSVRLGFSIATTLDADILIIDEVLSVGDLAFQRKCFSRMENLINGCNKTVLFVSHSIRQVERICTRVILLDNGTILADGKPDEVCELFYQRSNEKVRANSIQQNTKSRIVSSGEVELISVEILNEGGQPVDEILSGNMLRVRIRFKLMHLLTRPEILIGTHTTDFFYLTASSTAGFNDRPDYHPGVHEVESSILYYPLVAGTYCVRFVIYDQYRRTVFSGETLKVFSVAHALHEVHQAPLRTLDLPTEWKLDGKQYMLASSKHITT